MRRLGRVRMTVRPLSDGDVGRRSGEGSGVSASCPPSRAMPASTARSSAALAYRSPGFFAIERVSTALTSSAPAPSSWGTGALRWAIAISTSVPSYGVRPVRQTQNRQPRE